MLSRLSLIVVALLALLAGCSQQDDPVAPVIADQPLLRDLLEAPNAEDWPSAVVRAGYPLPESPDQALANFRDAYHGGDVATYAAMLSPDYRFVLLGETVDEFAWPVPHLTASDEIRIAFNMLLGLPAYDGERLTDVTIDRLEPLSAWSPVAAADPDFGSVEGARERTYEVRMIFARASGEEPWVAEGDVRFVVEPVMRVTNSAPALYYRLLGGVDLTERGDSPNEIPWGSVKIRFR